MKARSASVRRLADTLPAVMARLEGRRLAAVARALEADLPAGRGVLALDDAELIEALVAHGTRTLARSGAGPSEDNPSKVQTSGQPEKAEQPHRRAPSDDLSRRRYELQAEALVALRVAAALACRSAELAARALAGEGLPELACDLAEGLRELWPGAAALSCLRSVVLALPTSARQPAVGMPALMRCARWARDGTPVWIAAEALGVLCAAWPSEGHRIAASHLAPELEASTPPRPCDPRAFVLRARTLHYLTGSREGARLLVDHAQRDEPSALVRQRLIDSLLEVLSDDADPVVADALEGATTLEREPSMRVRAYAARRLAALLGGTHTPMVLGALRRAVNDPQLLVRRVAVQSLRARAAAGLRAAEPTGPLQDALSVLISLLSERRNAPHTSAAEAASVADAIEMLRLWADPVASELARAVEASLRHTPELGKVVVPLPRQMDGLAAGRVLAAMAQDGLGLYANLRTTGSASGERQALQIRHGARSRPRLWRLLHELRNPRPDKRRDTPHTVAPWTPEPLRAPPARLGAAWGTRLPGERRQVGYDGEWGRHLPMPDDLLDLGLLWPRQAQIFSSRGVTVLRPPPSFAGRLRMALHVCRRLAALSELRHRCLDPSAPTAQMAGRQTTAPQAEPAHGMTSSAYAEALAACGVTVELSPYDPDDPCTGILRSTPRPGGETVLGGGIGWVTVPGLPGLCTQQDSDPAPMATLVDGLTDGVMDGFADYLASPVGNDIYQLALFVALTGAGLLGVSLARQWRTERYRDRIPLTLGGWGTRGKSSLERLKAAMLTGMGCEVLCKTTGTVPTLVYSAPWAEPVQIPLFRPGGRATIWEQRDVLALAAKLGVQALAWECMAIRPRYASLMQKDWMRDTVATLTNTHPDHEDRQGPGAVDVARSLARFAPPGGTLITAEVSMLPVVRAEAEAAGSRVVALDTLEETLLPDDLMALFPYVAHRRNVALLRRLAAELGFDPDVATVEAAARVQPDIGALSCLGPFAVGDHRVSFVNAMSANDPASALDTLHRIAPDAPGGEEQDVVVVANTRRDRPGRTDLFARMLARDVHASLRIFTGTDSRDALARFRDEVTTLSAELTCQDVASMRAALGAVARRVGLHDLGVDTVARAALRAAPELPAETVRDLATRLLDAHDVPHDLAAARIFCRNHPSTQRLAALLDENGGPSLQTQASWLSVAVPTVALTALGRRFADALEAEDDQTQRRQVVALRQLATQLLLATAIAVPPDPDEVVAAALRRLPPGRVLLVGVQNIQGVGCALVSHFAAAQQIAHAATSASGPAPCDAHATPPRLDARTLAAKTRLGLIPAAAVLTALTDRPDALLRSSGGHGGQDALAAVRRVAQQRVARLLHGRRSRLERIIRAFVAPARAVIAAFLTPVLKLEAARTLRRLGRRKISAAEARRRLERLTPWQG